MSDLYTLTPEETVEVVDEAASRNIPLEIHAEGTSGGMLVARTRVLGMDAERVYLDGPQRAGKEVRFASGTSLVGHIALRGVRYEFRATVADAACVVKLNEQVYVGGMSIWRPQSANESQRRHDYRVSFARFDPVAVWMHEPSRSQPDAADLDALRHRVRLVNVSLGGMAVRVDMPPVSRFAPGRRWFLLFTLPKQSEPFVFLAEIRHSRSILDGQAAVLGLQFVPWFNRYEMQRQLNRLSRCLSEIQRTILAKRRVEVVFPANA